MIPCIGPYTIHCEATQSISPSMCNHARLIVAFVVNLSFLATCRTAYHWTNHTSFRLPNGQYARDCTEIFNVGHFGTGSYMIQPRDAPRPFVVICDMNTDGWTVLMRRFDGSVNFYRNWAQYKAGFGSVYGEHWLGNDYVNWLTSQKPYTLRIDLTFWVGGRSFYAEYNSFSLGDESTKYRLNIAGYTGNSGYEGMIPYNGRPFTTYDRDNDADGGRNCAQIYQGAFWYTKCHSLSHIFGRYQEACRANNCIEWGIHKSLKKITMRVKATCVK